MKYIEPLMPFLEQYFIHDAGLPDAALLRMNVEIFEQLSNHDNWTDEPGTVLEETTYEFVKAVLLKRRVEYEYELADHLNLDGLREAQINYYALKHRLSKMIENYPEAESLDWLT